MTPQDIIEDLKNTIKSQFEGDSSGHDWFHVERVWRNAKAIAEKENANGFITELGALLHDIADHKFVEDFEKESIDRTAHLLAKYQLNESTIQQVQHIVIHCSFKGGIGANKMKSLEGKIVQDADKLDAIGAIGIARTFAFGGKFGNELYNPKVAPIAHKSLESYQKNRSHTINHFYEKLLKLKDLMHTDTAKHLANQRHEYMEGFLNQFYSEWKAKID
ncbi:MAG: HD domain-containing protein [Putridiphycobacter sp.]|nr:HD domain-containing protein [Putridiphycobacter sp.]